MPLTRKDRRQLVAVLSAAAMLYAIVVLSPVKDPARWRDPAVERPNDMERVIGVYAVKGEGLVRYRVEYQAYPAERVEYWVEVLPGEGAAPCLGRPYRWTYPDEAERLETPEIPDRYLAALIKRRYK